jgi:hypothetical protein
VKVRRGAPSARWYESRTNRATPLRLEAVDLRQGVLQGRRKDLPSFLRHRLKAEGGSVSTLLARRWRECQTRSASRDAEGASPWRQTAP